MLPFALCFKIVTKLLLTSALSLAELKHKTALLQDNVVYQMTDHMDMIVKAKNHVANTLKGVRQLAETQ